jgi:hypothetical protein
LLGAPGPVFGVPHLLGNSFPKTETSDTVYLAMTTSIDSPRGTNSASSAGRYSHNLFGLMSSREAKKGKNALGGRRNSLKRFDSAKKIQAFPLIFLGGAWPDLGEFGKTKLALGSIKTAPHSMGSACAAMGG